MFFQKKNYFDKLYRYLNYMKQLYSRLINPVIWRFFCNNNIMDMAFS